MDSLRPKKEAVLDKIIALGNNQRNLLDFLKKPVENEAQNAEWDKKAAELETLRQEMDKLVDEFNGLAGSTSPASPTAPSSQAQ